MINSITKIFFGIFILSIIAFPLTAQKGNLELDIKSVKIDSLNSGLWVSFSAIKDGKFVDINYDSLQIFDIVQGGVPTIVEKLGAREKVYTSQSSQKDRSKNSTQGSPISIMFLIDRSGTMRENNAFEKAKEAVKSIVKDKELPNNVNIQLAFFHNEPFPTQTLTKENIDRALDTVKFDPSPSKYYTNLYGTLNSKIKELKSRDGKRVIILLTDGKHDLGPKKSIKSGTQKGIYNQITGLDSNFLFFPVGLGNKAGEGFLKQLVKLSKSTEDGYNPASVPEILKDKFSEIIEKSVTNHEIQFFPTDSIIKGRNRVLLFRMDNVEATFPYKISNYNNQRTLVRRELLNKANRENQVLWSILIAIGIGLILVVFAIFNYLIPIIKRRQFSSKYVQRYKKIKDKIKKTEDPISGARFKDNDLIVTRCEMIALKSTWRDNNFECQLHPGCIHSLNCKHKKDNMSFDFMAQKGMNKRFSWAWFGMLGGFLAWLSYILTTGFFNLTSGQLLQSLIGTSSNSTLQSSKGFKSYLYNNAEFITESTVEGFFVGLFLGLTITFAEEKGRPRYGRILGRGFLFAFISSLLYFFRPYVERSMTSDGLQIISILIFALLFGLLLGWILSIKSTLFAKNSILGGIIASVIGVLIFYFITNSQLINAEGAKMIGYMILGALLGYIIVSVVSRAENFEIEIIEPAKINATFPITKWLKSGNPVFVGKDRNVCDIFLKWERDNGPIQPKHAELSFESTNGKVYITPIGPVEINNHTIPLKSRSQLNNNDIITFGPKSITRVRYIEKNASEINDPQPITNGKSKITIKGKRN